MFTPPPSPLPPPSLPADADSPPALSLSTPESRSEYPFPPMSTTSPKSPCIAEAGAARIPLELKKRMGRRILLLVILIPAVLIVSASLRHLIPLSSTVHLDEHPPLIFDKRVPQLLTESAGTPTITSGFPSSTLSEPTLPSGAPVVPTVPTSAALPTPFPQPFDESLSANFSTVGCEDFFSNFTLDENFRQCRSFSFLLNASSAFLQAQRNITLFNNILWGTCNTVPTIETCAATMSSYLEELNDVCQGDIAAENPVALQAQVGFQSYTAMRTVACLEDPSTNSFCYVEAVAATTPADIYFYAVPLGTPLPNNTTPSCSPCVKSVLAVYAQYVTPMGTGSGTISVGSSEGNSSTSGLTPSPLPLLSKTYPDAARIAVSKCGGTYANVGVADPNGAIQHSFAWGWLVLSLVLGTWML